MQVRQRLICRFCFLFFLFIAPAWGQLDQGTARSAMRIMVFVRLANNSAAPAGIPVRLEADQGGVVDQQMTDSTGKVYFIPKTPTGYTVVVRHPGYREILRHVDLTLTPTASVNLELVPLPGNSPAVSSATTVSATDELVPEDARREYQKGKELLEGKRDPSGSRSHFEKAIKMDGNFTDAYVMLGVAYLQEQKFSDAKAALEHAIRLNSASGPAFLTLGACLNQQKDFAAAETALLKGLQLVPDSPEGHYELGKTYWGLHRWQDADPHAQKAVQLLPNVPGTHVLMGNILLQKRDSPGALKEFQEYLKLEPSGPMSDAVRAMVSKLQKASG